MTSTAQLHSDAPTLDAPMARPHHSLRAHSRRTLACLGAGVLASCGPGSQPALDPSLVHAVHRGDLEITIRERGEVSAARDTKVVSELEGRATLIYLIPEGSVVTEGTKVAELDASGIVEKRTLEEISVARAEAAVTQARKNEEIVERELSAADGTAASQLEIARLHARKLMGQPSSLARDQVTGTNAQVLEELRTLVHAESSDGVAEPRGDSTATAAGPDGSGERASRRAPTHRVTSLDLVDKVMDLFETEENRALQMGELGNQILQQISKINLARADLEIAADTLRYSEQLAAEGFLTRSELSRDRINHQRRVADMSLAWNDLELLVNYTLPESKITSKQEVENANLGLESTRAKGEAQRVRVASDLASAESELLVARERLDTYNSQIRKSVLLAPSDGLVVYGRFDWDEPVYEGMDVRERQDIVILPDVTSMVAELLVHEAQIDQVAAGQSATVVVDAFPGREFSARVESVSTLPDVRGSWRRDVKVYTVRVALDGQNEDGALRPGMNSTIRIDVGTLHDVLTLPLPALERRGDRHYVWRVTDSGPTATRVTIGRNNLTHVEIVDGLAEGDRVYLVPPAGLEVPGMADAPGPESTAPEPPLAVEATGAGS